MLSGKRCILEVLQKCLNVGEKMRELIRHSWNT